MSPGSISLSLADRSAWDAALGELERDQQAAQLRADPVAWVESRLGEHVWSKQSEIMRAVVDHRRVAVRSCHGVGKALHVHTPLPTPDGWTTMGAVSIGDQLLDEHGKPVNVTAVSPVQYRPTYRVQFEDGTDLIASDNHEWQVVDLRHRPRNIADWRDHWAVTVTRTTLQLAEELRYHGQLRWRVPNARPVQGAPVSLPMGAYTLGLWLGDGTSDQAAFICHNDDAPELLAHIAADGIIARPRPSAMRPSSTSYDLLGILPALRGLGVFKDKHIPPGLFRADVETRLALLQGLMDTDGFVSTGQSVGIDICNQRLAADIADLVVSMGWKAFRTTKPAKYYGRTVGTVYRLQFRPDMPVFRLARKAAKLGRTVTHRSRHTQRTIVAVEQIKTMPTKCVMVDSPTHLYLAGRSMVPTHNSHLASRIVAWWLSVHPVGEAFVVTTAPTYAQVRAILWRYIRQAHRRGGLPGRVNQTEWHLGEDLVAFGRKPADHDEAAFQGIHARYVLVVIDEACGVPEQLWTAADALTTNDDCRILAIGNPDNSASHFARVCGLSSPWHRVGISAFDSPNFTGEDVPDELRHLLISRSWAEEKLTEWGEDNPIYRSKVLGEFSIDDPGKVVRGSDLAACRIAPEQHWPGERLQPVSLGVDVGGGGDETVVRERRGVLAGREWREFSDQPSTIAPLILRAIRETGATEVKVDEIGVGRGVIGELHNMASEGRHEARVVGVNVAGKARRSDLYENIRAEMWWEVGRLFCQDRLWDLSSMDNADTTVAQLLEPKWEIGPNGRIRIEKKDEVIKRLGRSPDNADALLLAFFTPSGSATNFLDQLVGQGAA